MGREGLILICAGAGFVALYTAPYWWRRCVRGVRRNCTSDKEDVDDGAPNAEEHEHDPLLEKLRVSRNPDGGILVPVASPVIRKRKAFPRGPPPPSPPPPPMDEPTTPTPSDDPTKKKKKKRVQMCLERNEVIGEKPANKAAVVDAAGKKTELESTPIAEALKGGASAATLRKLNDSRDPSVPLCTADENTGRTLLHLAAEVMVPGQEDVLSWLVNDLHVDPNAQNRANGNITALIFACAACRDAVATAFVQFFSSLPADPKTGIAPLNFANAAGWSALHVACGRNRAPIVTALLDAGAATDVKNSQGCTPLHITLLSGAKDAALALLTHSRIIPDINARDAKRATPLHLAMNGGFALYPVASRLIELGADVNARDENMATPLHWALRRGHGRLSALLLMNGADVTIGDEPHCVTALHLAASTGDLGMLETFLNNRPGVNLEVKDTAGCTPLLIAAMGGHQSIVGRLLEMNAKLDVKDKEGATPLLWALRKGHKEVAARLVEGGAPLAGTSDVFGNTPLLLACYRGKAMARFAEMLLDRSKRDINVPERNGFTPLHWAAAHGDTQLCTALIDAGADIDARDLEHGVLPLHWASFTAQPNAVEMLVLEATQRKGCSTAEAANATDRDGRTPLHWLCRRAKKDHTLIEGHVGQDEEEETTGLGGSGVIEKTVDPSRIVRVLDLLVSFGGDMGAADKDNVTPRDLLSGTPYLETATHLVEAAASESQGGGFVAFDS